MKSLLFLATLAATTLHAFDYPPEFEDARVETYREADGATLRLWIFGAVDPATPKPAIVFFFGGGWNSGSPAQFERQARHFAERGMIAITADYRVRSRHHTPASACVEDGKAAVAWVREHAARLCIDPARIAAAGGSAGGHVAASTATLEGFGSDEHPNALVLFNPALALADIGDWKARGFGVRVARERLGTEPAALSPAHHVGAHTPATLILHGTADTTVPIASAEAFAAAMEKAGRPCKLVRYEGAGHGFFNSGASFTETLAEADRFLVGLGWLAEPEP